MAKPWRGQHRVLRVPRPPPQRHRPEGQANVEHFVEAPCPLSGKLQRAEPKEDNDQVLCLAVALLFLIKGHTKQDADKKFNLLKQGTDGEDIFRRSIDKEERTMYRFDASRRAKMEELDRESQ